MGRGAEFHLGSGGSGGPLEVRVCLLLFSSFVIFPNRLAILVPLHFCINFGISLSVSPEIMLGFDWDGIDSVSQFGEN